MNKSAKTFRIVFALLLLNSVSGIVIAGSPAQVPEAIWEEPESGLLVRTHPCENEKHQLCGTITNVPSDVSETDEKNPDPSLKARPLLDLEILTGFEAVDANRWQGGGDYGRRPGRIYLPVNGDTLGDHKNCYEILVEENQLVVRIARCGFLSCLAKSVWKRVE